MAQQRPRLDSTLRAMARDTVLSRSSRNLLSPGVVKLASFTSPMRWLMWWRADDTEQA